MISVPETEPHCSRYLPSSFGDYARLVISVPETEPHCSNAYPLYDWRTEDIW